MLTTAERVFPLNTRPDINHNFHQKTSQCRMPD